MDPGLFLLAFVLSQDIKVENFLPLCKKEDREGVQCIQSEGASDVASIQFLASCAILNSQNQ